MGNLNFNVGSDFYPNLSKPYPLFQDFNSLNPKFLFSSFVVVDWFKVSESLLSSAFQQCFSFLFCSFYLVLSLMHSFVWFCFRERTKLLRFDWHCCVLIEIDTNTDDNISNPTSVFFFLLSFIFWTCIYFWWICSFPMKLFDKLFICFVCFTFLYKFFYHLFSLPFFLHFHGSSLVGRTWSK